MGHDPTNEDQGKPRDRVDTEVIEEKIKGKDTDKYVCEIDSIKANDGIMHLQIIDIELIGSGTRKHNVYRIKGKDNLGEIDVTRRYKEFF